VERRVDRIIERARALPGDALVFAHGHVLRVLAARWLGLGAADGRMLALSTATISILGWERETPVIERWNDPCEEAVTAID
jgi:probable phosphoglycerate mutase